MLVFILLVVVAHFVALAVALRQILAALPPHGTAIPAQELANLCSVWRGHAAQCEGDLRLTLESCALDLDRLRDSYENN